MNISDAEPNFLSLWEEGSLCDVELRTADGALVPAHRIVLAAASPFFRALFVGSGRTMREGAEEGSVIDLPGVEEAELRVLLKAVYSNSAADIDARSVALLLAAASYLSVAAVREACARYLQTELSLSTAVETLALAERYDCADLRGDAVRFLQAHLVPLLQSADAASLQLLPLDLFQELLSSDELEVNGESDVAHAAAVWILGDVAQRAQHARALLSTARAPLTATACLAATEEALSTLAFPPSEDNLTATALRTAINTAAEELAAAHRSGTAYPPSSPRLGSPTELMALGGVDEGWRSLRTVELYDPRKDEWRAGPAMLAPCSFAAGCTLGSQAYAIEGSAHLPVSQIYDRQKKRWKMMPRPCTARVNMAAAALPRYGVFVLGGRVGTGRAGVSLNSVDRFDPETGTWQEASLMGFSRTSLAACALEGQKIFAIGGQSDRITHDCAEWFDPGTDTWYPIAEKMRSSRKYLGAAAVGGQVVVVGGMAATWQRLASVEAYDPREGRWRELPSLSVPRSSCGVTVLHGEVFVAGGSVGDGAADPGVECLAVTAGRWRKCAPMAAGRSGLALTPV